MDPFLSLFNTPKPLIACIHLQALPGSPGYTGNFKDVLEKALWESRIFMKHGVDGLIVENFRDMPFYPDRLPTETVASLAVATSLVKSVFIGPVGVNALRNDAAAALSTAHASGADFIRVNVHTGAAITDQGIIEGKAFDTLRLKKNLQSHVKILADVRVKHAVPLAESSIKKEVDDNLGRGMADGIIVSGAATGHSVDLEELKTARNATQKPLLVGSGTTLSNVREQLEFADGFIVGSYFKRAGDAFNEVMEEQVERFMNEYRKITYRI